MTEPQQGYTVGVPKPKGQRLDDAWDWMKENVTFLLKLSFVIGMIFMFFLWIGASIRADEYEKDSRADCYGSMGTYASVGFGDDLCYRDGKVIKVYQA